MKHKKEKEMGSLPCWEFKKCGHEKDGKCPAVTLHAGRSCWLVAGTLCGGKATGIFAQKIGDCKLCDFYIRGLCE